MKKGTYIHFNERDQFIDQINAEKSLDQRIELIEKLVNPGWLHFPSEIERHITIPLILFNTEKKKPKNEVKEKKRQVLIKKEEVVQSLIYKYYSAIRIATNQTRNAGKKELEFGPRTSEEVLLFNFYLIELFFPSSQVMIERFEEMASKSSEEPQLVKLEIRKFNKLIKMVSDEDTNRISSTNISYRINKKLDWRRTFFNGFSTIIVGAKQADLSKYIPLPQLYFYHLGVVYGEYYRFLRERYEDVFNKEVDDKPFLVQEQLFKAGPRLLLMYKMGLLDKLKEWVHTNSFINKRFLRVLQAITGIKESTLNAILSNFTPKDIDGGGDKNNPIRYIENYEVLIDFSNKLGMPEISTMFQEEKVIMENKGFFKRTKKD